MNLTIFLTSCIELCSHTEIITVFRLVFLTSKLQCIDCLLVDVWSICVSQNYACLLTESCKTDIHAMLVN